MTKNKAFEILKTFTSNESKDFELFIGSPLFNSNKNLVKLFALYKKYSSPAKEEKNTEEYLYGKIFPGKKYNYGIMKNLVSGLFSLCEKFLAVYIQVNASNEDIKKAEFEEGLKRLDEFISRSLDKLFFAEYRNLKKKLQYSAISPVFYLNKSRLVEKLHKYYAKKNLYQNAANTLYPMSIYNSCYIISTLKHDIAGMDYLKNQINFVPVVNLTETFYRNFDSVKFLNEIIDLEPEYYNHIALELMLMKLYTEPQNRENYLTLKKLIINNIIKYSNAERWHLTSSLMNFLLTGYIAGNKDLLMDIAAIRRIQLANVKFNTEGMGPLQAGTFRNIVEAFLILGEKDYAEEFINKFTVELEEDKRASAYSYSMALIEESRGNNEKSLDYIRNIEFTDYQTKFSAKMIVLVAFYNLGYVEQGLSAIDSLKHFIKDTDEFSVPAKKNLSGRVSMIEKLYKIRANPEKYSIDDIITLEKSAASYLAARKEWYLAKTAELKKLVN